MKKYLISTIAAVAFATSALADITMIVPQKPGAGTSVWAQIIAVELQKHLPYLVQALAWKKLNMLFPEIEHTMIMGCTDKRGPYFWVNLKGTRQEQLRQMFRMTRQELKHIPLLKLGIDVMTRRLGCACKQTKPLPVFVEVL